MALVEMSVVVGCATSVKQLASWQVLAFPRDYGRGSWVTGSQAINRVEESM